MTSNNWLFITIVAVIGVTCYLIATGPDITSEEREIMEEEWWG